MEEDTPKARFCDASTIRLKWSSRKTGGAELGQRMYLLWFLRGISADLKGIESNWDIFWNQFKELKCAGRTSYTNLLDSMEKNSLVWCETQESNEVREGQHGQRDMVHPSPRVLIRCSLIHCFWVVSTFLGTATGCKRATELTEELRSFAARMSSL